MFIVFNVCILEFLHLTYCGTENRINKTESVTKEDGIVANLIVNEFLDARIAEFHSTFVNAKQLLATFEEKFKSFKNMRFSNPDYMILMNECHAILYKTGESVFILKQIIKGHIHESCYKSFVDEIEGDHDAQYKTWNAYITVQKNIL